MCSVCAGWQLLVLLPLCCGVLSASFVLFWQLHKLSLHLLCIVGHDASPGHMLELFPFSGFAYEACTQYCMSH
jgi:hypothetical protein